VKEASSEAKPLNNTGMKLPVAGWYTRSKSDQKQNSTLYFEIDICQEQWKLLPSHAMRLQDTGTYSDSVDSRTFTPYSLGAVFLAYGGLWYCNSHLAIILHFKIKREHLFRESAAWALACTCKRQGDWFSLKGLLVLLDSLLPSLPRSGLSSLRSL
jgi:hypothetical protein